MVQMKLGGKNSESVYISSATAVEKNAGETFGYFCVLNVLMGVSEVFWRILNCISSCCVCLNSTSSTLHHMDSITFSFLYVPLESNLLIVVHNDTCGDSSLKSPPIGFNKLRQHARQCQAAAREQGEHKHQVEQEHAVHFFGSSHSPNHDSEPTNILVWFHSVGFASVLIGGLYSEPSTVKTAVQWSWLWLFSVCI